jgi:H+/Cl- antiporter ClcA/CBS domain-containing protein
VGESERASAPGIPVAPSLEAALENADVGERNAVVDRRVVLISAMAVGVAILAGLVAQGLTYLITLVTHIAFYGKWSFDPISPADNTLGAWVIIVPVLGGVIVGLMARYGAKAIRGHGIPEAMEVVLTNQSRIPARLTFLKPLSAAVAIGTGGPFGAEGPIIATGGAMGSLLGQIVHTTASERKTLLAAGAAAGMAATFGSPVSAVVLAIELLLFEYRPRSLIPVALAAAAATATRIAFVGDAPVFPMPDLAAPSGEALACYVALGALVGVAATVVSSAVYWIEDAFERLPIHWMWWPALGGIAVGLVGWFAPRTLGVGYNNIEDLLNGHLALGAVAILAISKFVSWAIALGSGTSGGTLAPLLTMGAGLGTALGALINEIAPSAGVDVRIAALVGMAAMFGGAARALLASVVFAFEITRQPIGLLPLLGGGAAAFLVACLLAEHSIMTEKIARRGLRIRGEYAVDHLTQVSVGIHGRRDVVSVRAMDTVGAVRAWMASGAAGTEHQGFPVVDSDGLIVGVITRRDLAEPHADDASVTTLIKRPPVVITDDASLRDAADRMANERLGRLPVVTRAAPLRVIGILTRSDLLAAHAPRLADEEIDPNSWRPPMPKQWRRALVVLGRQGALRPLRALRLPLAKRKPPPRR